MRKIFISNKGFTLVEIMISIALLGIIAIAFIPLYTMSAKVTNSAKHTLEATYTGKDAMELMYNLISNESYEDLEAGLVAEGYSKDNNNLFIYETPDNKWIELEYDLIEQGDLVRVIIRVYSDSSREKLESKYEAYYTEGDSYEG